MIIKFDNTEIQCSKSVKYLGITIDEKLNFSQHTKLGIAKAKGAKKSLFPLLKSRSPLSLKSKLYMYKTYLRPILIYAAPVWAPNISRNAWKRMEAFQTVTLRQITDAHYSRLE